MSSHSKSAIQIVAALRGGEVESETVRQTQLDRISRFNKDINAVVALTDQTGSRTAGGALAGLPITVKDQVHVAGQPCTFGSPTHKDFRPTETASVIKNLQDAGATIIGRTNLPPFAMDFQCSNPLFGTTNNPWNLDYTSGGSSGGGAAAVAAGLSFLDIGTDLSGSLRIPASFCGVFSLLPTEGTLPNDGMMANGAAPLKHFARFGPIARTADDLALAWQHMSGQSQGNHEACSMPRVCWSTDCDGPSVSRGIRKCLESAVAQWSDAHVATSQMRPSGFDFKLARRTFGEIMGFETGELMPPAVRFLGRFLGRSSARRSPEFLANVMRGYKHSQKNYRAAIEEKQRLSALVDDFLGEDTVWVLPVTAVSTFKHMKPTSDRNGLRDYASPLFIDGKPISYFDALTSFVTPVTLIGNPVVTLPIGLDDNGLPVGVQVIGRKGKEAALLKTASHLSNALTMPVCPYLETQHAQ